MKKLKTKSILACAVLASVLAGGFFVFASAEAAQVNALVMPKDINSSSYGNIFFCGKEIFFGQKRGFSSNQYQIDDRNKVGVIDETPTWQIIAFDNDIITLLAKESWGKNRATDTNTYYDTSNPGATVQHFYHKEVLKCLEDKKSEFFSPEELSLLVNQEVTERRGRLDKVRSYFFVNESLSKYECVFGMPSKELLNDLTPEQKKRAESYWIDNCNFVFQDDGDIVNPGKKLWYDQSFVDTNGNYQVANGEEVKDFYPLLKVKVKPVFAYYGDRPSVDSSFQKHMADSTQPLHVALRNAHMEKDVQIEALEIAADKIKFTTDGLATGEGQGLAGILADNEENYVSYVRLADTTSSGRVENKEITADGGKFLDNQFGTGNYTVYLFNEKLSAGNDYLDYVGNFSKLIQVDVNDSGAITKATLSGNCKISNFTVPENISFGYTMANYPGENPQNISYNTFTVTNSLNWANVLNSQGRITLKGSFSVANDTLTLALPQGHDGNKDGWNDMTYDGGEGKTATLHVKGDMHGLIVNGGTFIAEKDLKLSDYLKINNDATVEVKGKLNVALSGEITGTLKAHQDLDLNGFWHVYKNSKISAPHLSAKNGLMLEQDAVIDGICNILDGGILYVISNCSIKGVNFADGSKLEVDGNKVKDKAAITYTDDIQAADNSKLIIKNQKEGVEYKIVEKKPQLMLMVNGLGNSNSTPDLEKIVWPEYGLVVDEDNSVFDNSKCVVTFEKDPELPEYSDIPNIVTGLINQKESVPWIQELTNEFQTYPDKELYLEALNNSANTLANLNSLANVQGGLRTMSSLVTDSIYTGTRMKEQGAREDVWASFIHNKEKIEGRKTGHLKQNSTLQYNGVVVGADLWKSEHGFGGVALHYGDGNFRSSQMVNTVKNEADYYGISVYNRQDVGKFNFVYDGGFTYGKNDITLATAWEEEITAKPKAMAYNLGFKVEEPIKLSKATELTPFAGLRYTFIKTKDYTDNYADGYSADNQHLVNLPIGLTLKGSYEIKEGWTLGGNLTGGYNWNLGNRTSTQSMEYAGFSDSMNFDLADRGEYFVKAALTAEHKNLAFELGYRYSKGDTSRDNRWNVNMNWSF